ncbi:phosphoribulokinase [Rossellomorea sp. AcN35-11]|nr:phosphoribulokinase [Rossellomorea aquimaris]WJV29985.1 phosphoribulokinase [Rossellomorea sp. AcN35-11]
MEEIIHRVAERIKRDDKRVIIGISGHGASGKTTFTGHLMEHLGRNQVNAINTDAYIVSSPVRKGTLVEYEYQNEKHHSKMTACHSAAHHVWALERDVRMIREGMDVYTMETPYEKRRLISSQNRVSIVEGMSVAFTDPDLYDLKIYFYTDGETEFMRRSTRDIAERGMELDYLKRTHDERRIQYELFMHPYHEHFDVVIRNSADVEKAVI